MDDVGWTLKAAMAALVLWAPAPGLGGGADIVFVYDNSGSMWSHYAQVDSLTGDTSFFQASGCPGGVGTGTIGTPLTYTTLAGPRTVQRVDAAMNCQGQAGDPYIARTAVISQAVDFLAASYPASTAGAIAFAHVADHARTPLPLSGPGNADSVKVSLALDSINNTNYVPPLVLAASWLQDEAYIRNARQAIVFISDGEPNDGAAFTTWLNLNTRIPIYCLALRDSSMGHFARMQEMSLRTGGRYYSVPPEDVPGMNRVMEDILAQLASAVQVSRPVPGSRIRVDGLRPGVDAAGRRVPDAAASGPRFPAPR